MDFTIPVADVKVDTNDLPESGKNFAGAVAGFLGLFGVVGVATYAYSRIKNLAGVEGEQSIPGV